MLPAANHDKAPFALAPAGRTHLPWLTLLPALALALCCLLTGGCDRGRDETDAPAPGNNLAPLDIFSRRAPSPPSPPPAVPTARKILVVGDSLSISLGEQLERVLAGTPGLDFSRDGMRSSGLTRPELVDWPARLAELTAHGGPDVVVIMLGANDIMPVEGRDGERVYFDSPAWPDAYAAKAGSLVDICRKANPRVSVYWVGVPSMGEASLAEGSRRVNAALAAMCAAAGCRFIDTRTAFSDPAGRFTKHGRDAATGDLLPLRAGDGVHLTESGAKYLAGLVLRAVADQEKFPPNAGVDELRALARDIRPVADETPPAPRREAPGKKIKVSRKSYEVRKGDTLTIVAKRLGVPLEDLEAVNPGVDSRRLSTGQSLRVPARR